MMLVQSYKMILVNNVVHGAVTANNNLKRCEVGWGVTTGDIGVNRREKHLMEEQRWEQILRVL